MRIKVFILICFLTASTHARIITVDDDLPADFSNIQAAINDANNGDTVIVADGVYTGPGNRDIDFNGKAITVCSANGPENCIIDCNATESDRHRGFVFWSGEDANSAIIGFTITNGYGPIEMLPTVPEIFKSVGGAIYCLDSSPTISNCIISENKATSGGGLFSFESFAWAAPTVINCTFSHNLAASHGGGIDCVWAHSFTLTLTNCILWGNRDNGGTDESAQIRGTTAVVNYCSIQGLTGVLGGTGNIGDDPCFADANNDDYHLKSQAGRWDPNSQSWVQDVVTSPCIDRGNPNSAIGLEPFPNGGRINMGAYGGTAKASKSYFGKPVCETIVAGDINGDCRIDWLDFAIMAFHWLEDNNE